MKKKLALIIQLNRFICTNIKVKTFCDASLSQHEKLNTETATATEH